MRSVKVLAALLILIAVAACSPESSSTPQALRNPPTLTAPLWSAGGDPLTADNIAEARYVGRMDPAEPVSTVFQHTFAQGGAQLIGLNNEQLLAWNFSSGQLAFQTSRAAAVQVYVSPDQTEIYGVTSNGQIAVFDAVDGSFEIALNGIADWSGAVAYNPTLGRMILGSTTGAIREWDVPQRRAFETLEAHTTSIGALSYNSDSTRLVSAAADAVYWWDWPTAERLTDFVPDNPVGRLIVNAQNIVGIGTELDARLWIAALDVRRLETGRGGGQVLMFSPDSRYLLTGNATNGLALYQTEDAQLTGRLPDVTGARISAAFSPNNDLLVTSVLGGAVSIWNLGAITEQTVPRADLNVGTSEIVRVDWSPDGRHILLFSTAGPIYVWGLPG